MLVLGIATCATALARQLNRLLAVATGLGLCATGSLLAALSPWNPGYDVAEVVALLVLGGSGARVLPRRQALSVAAIGAVVLGADPLARVHLSPPTQLATRVLLVVTAWAGALTVGLWLRWRDDQRAAALEAVRRGERLGLARELHDLLAHHVTGIVLQAQAARVVGGRHPEKLEPMLAEIETAGAEALTAMRRLVGLLRDADDGAGRLSGPGDLRTLVDAFGNGIGVSARLSMEPPGLDSTWPPEVVATAYRVVQEGLTNVARHAVGIIVVEVRVRAEAQTVSLQVLDDGEAARGQPSPGRGGFGLTGMRERVEALGGQLWAGPRDGGGWLIRATLPVPSRGRT